MLPSTLGDTKDEHFRLNPGNFKFWEKSVGGLHFLAFYINIFKKLKIGASEMQSSSNPKESIKAQEPSQCLENPFKTKEHTETVYAFHVQILGAISEKNFDKLKSVFNRAKIKFKTDFGKDFGEVSQRTELKHFGDEYGEDENGCYNIDTAEVFLLKNIIEKMEILDAEQRMSLIFLLHEAGFNLDCRSGIGFSEENLNPSLIINAIVKKYNSLCVFLDLMPDKDFLQLADDLRCFRSRGDGTPENYIMHALFCYGAMGIEVKENKSKFLNDSRSNANLQGKAYRRSYENEIQQPLTALKLVGIDIIIAYLGRSLAIESFSYSMEKLLSYTTPKLDPKELKGGLLSYTAPKPDPKELKAADKTPKEVTQQDSLSDPSFFNTKKSKDNKNIRILNPNPRNWCPCPIL